MNDWNALRDLYAELTPQILATPRNEWVTHAYSWNEGEQILTMTPIEAWLWHDIRTIDAVLYPQYPVGRVFVDFANPKAKVAIECDGAAFHDARKDAERDARLAELGWRVYRAPGWLCRTDFDEKTMRISPAHQFVREIAEHHRIVRGQS